MRMSKPYLIDYILRNKNNHPLSCCNWDSAIINTTNNNLIVNPTEVVSVLLNLLIITGQKPKIKRAKKNFSAFNIRTGNINGTMVELRKGLLSNFVKKLIFLIFPNLQLWQNLHAQNKNYYIFNAGFNNTWLDQPDKVGLHIQLIVKQKAKDKDFLFFLSRHNLFKK